MAQKTTVVGGLVIVQYIQTFIPHVIYIRYILKHSIGSD